MTVLFSLILWMLAQAPPSKTRTQPVRQSSTTFCVFRDRDIPAGLTRIDIERDDPSSYGRLSAAGMAGLHVWNERECAEAAQAGYLKQESGDFQELVILDLDWHPHIKCDKDGYRPTFDADDHLVCKPK